MTGVLSRVDREARRDALVAFATLLLLIAGHTVLETARDALFLASIPASKLPIAYLAVAALAFAATTLLDRIGDGHRRATLVGWLLGSAVLTGLFFAIVDGGSSTSLYALYAWGGVLTTVVLTRFWGLLAARFTVVQAKAVYPFIGAGSVAGALAGTGLAGLLTTTFQVEGRWLLLVSAGLLAASALIPLGLGRREDDDPGDDDDDGAGNAQEETRRGPRAGADGTPEGWSSSPTPTNPMLLAALRRTYPRRVVLVVVLSAVTLTVVDFVFKATVAEAVPAEDLAAFFARVYFGLNLLSLLAQLLLVRVAVRLLTVTGALTVLPALLVGGSVFFALASGVWAALALKAADGALRHSLHRTAVELLYVPMSPAVRNTVKTFADVVGQRGGQALASLALLGAFAIGVDVLTQDVAIVVLAVLWIGLALMLRGPYFDLFRNTLQEEARRVYQGFPDLDRSSLEALIATLNSVNDREVLAALDSLEGEGKVRLVPALILYHPSPEVVVRSLELLAAHDRRDILPITDRLLDPRGDHPPMVRAAALRARILLEASPRLLRSFLEDASSDVRATALVGLAAQFGDRLDEGLDRLWSVVRGGDRDARLAAARAIAHRPAPVFHELVLALSGDDDPEVRSASLDAMRADPDPVFEPRLCALLRYRATRPRARAALVALGDSAFDTLTRALDDPSRPTAERRHVPRTLMLFDPPRAARVLLDHYPSEPDRIVQHKILRALAYLQRKDPRVDLRRSDLEPLLLRAVAQALAFRDERLALERGAAADDRVESRFHRLLVRLLRDLEHARVEQVFSLLALSHPDEDVRAIQRGLRSHRRGVRASATELLQHLLDGALRDVFIALVDLDEPDPERPLRLGTAYYLPRDRRYAEVVEDLLDDANEAVRSLAVYQVGVLGMRELLPEIRSMAARRGGLLAEATRRVQEQLASVRPPVAEASS